MRTMFSSASRRTVALLMIFDLAKVMAPA